MNSRKTTLIATVVMVLALLEAILLLGRSRMRQAQTPVRTEAASAERTEDLERLVTRNLHSEGPQDVLRTDQGAAVPPSKSTQSPPPAPAKRMPQAEGVDVNYLVNAVNKLTGSLTAEAIAIGDEPAILYRRPRPGIDDPFWSLIEVIDRAGALKQIHLLDPEGGSSSVQTELMDFGVPSSKIRLRAAWESRMVREGIILVLKKLSKS